MQAHECGLSEECSQRHARQDELNNQIRDIHDALLGTALSNEPSIKEKVSEMYDERKAVKKWLAGTAVSIVVFITVLRQDKMQYKITQSQIIVEYPAIGYVTDYANIKDIKMSRSIFNKNVGTIRFKLKKGLSMNFQFAGIDDVDKVYDLLLSLWKGKQPNQ